MALSIYAVMTQANHPLNRSGRAGFTILELSVVLVIIGLLTAAILGGQNLIDAAKIRAQIGQIDQFNTAVGMFQTKYGSLPGDMNAVDAATYGFASRPGTGNTGGGDGNGIIEAPTWDWSNNFHYSPQLCGEVAMFWNDLGTAQLIPGAYVGGAGTLGTNTCPTAATPAVLATLIPRAKMGAQAFITVVYDPAHGNHYFQIVVGYTIDNTGRFVGAAGPEDIPLTPIEAYKIDQKIDDGLPLSGSVTARLTDALEVFTWGPPSIQVPAAAAPGVCVVVTTNLYNISPSTGGKVPACSIRFPFSS
jgi:prepilin-type N-terminal cleavage/methylation domain-containing protein